LPVRAPNRNCEAAAEYRLSPFPPSDALVDEFDDDLGVPIGENPFAIHLGEDVGLGVTQRTAIDTHASGR
jgi:hypothetical protein